MASFTEADLANLNEAIASGVAEVATADGKKVRYQSLSDLIRARDLLLASLQRRPARPILARIPVR